MSPELILFAKQYRRFLLLFSLWVACTGYRWRPDFVFSLGRRWNPFRFHGQKIRRSIGLALPENKVEQTWRNWLNSHVHFTLDFLAYKSLDVSWLRRCVLVSDPVLLEALRQSGGLLLTYHTHHQNTLCCALGLQGVKVSAIASSPEDSPLFSYIGSWAKRVNVDSARHFRGGGYIFTDNLRTLLRATRQLFANRELVVCLCDFHQPKPDAKVSAKLFDRQISPPTGVIELAIKHAVPIFAAMFAPQNGKLVLQMIRLDASAGVDGVVARYFSFLESNIQIDPACWQGWEWYENIPLAEQVNS